MHGAKQADLRVHALAHRCSPVWAELGALPCPAKWTYCGRVVIPSIEGLWKVPDLRRGWTDASISPVVQPATVLRTWLKVTAAARMDLADPGACPGVAFSTLSYTLWGTQKSPALRPACLDIFSLHQSQILETFFYGNLLFFRHSSLGSIIIRVNHAPSVTV